MLRNYLKTLYLNRVVPLNTLRQELNSWNITESRLERNFNFTSFEKAVEFVSMANSYTNDKGINSTISNVYNKVKVSINTADQFTDRELNTARFLQSLESVNTIDRFLVSDFYKNYYERNPQIDYNNHNVPTLLDNNSQFTSFSTPQELKLLR